jgi:hypothetical protein
MPNVKKSGSLNLLEPSGSHRACYGTALPLLWYTYNYTGYFNSTLLKILVPNFMWGKKDAFKNVILKHARTHTHTQRLNKCVSPERVGSSVLVKQPARESDLSLPSSVEFRNGWSPTCSHPICLHAVHMDKFIFAFNT